MIATLPAPLTIVISQGQSRAPEKRGLEQSIAQRAAEIDPSIAVLVVPHLYDLPNDGTTLHQLRQIPGDLVVVSWMYERAAHWILDRGGVRGQFAAVALCRPQEEDDDDDDDDANEEKSHVVDDQPRPERQIYCLDLRVSESADAYVSELIRIVQLPRAVASLERLQRPTNDTALPFAALSEEGLILAPADEPIGDQSQAHAAIDAPSNVGLASAGAPEATDGLWAASGLKKIEEHPTRRWYPVIDYSRCTNCMECIDFCLFGVYGMDRGETILVEQPDNCRKGCPACSRVCPENAIIFPQHKTPAIAGAPVTSADTLKIDLSKLFGAPDTGEDAVAAAIRERDEQLILTGRQAVGDSVGLRDRTAGENGTEDGSNRGSPSDPLDQLIDQLDQLDL
jgi:NAD-dependent dihydropyrimidine dehydrogenase PreA subunit